MKKLFTLGVLGLTGTLFAQTIIYSENFNGAHTFTLNSTDMSSTSSGNNSWLVNSNYNGGTVIETCTGFDFPINIGSTQSQPGGITGSPNSGYLHICSDWGQTAGVLNGNFQAADGSCQFAEGYFAKMTNDISTLGQTGVIFSFWWLLAGGSNSFGEVYFSTNGGSSWNLQQGNMFGQSSWVQANYTNAAFDNQATLRFGFKFVNNVTFSASDPAFCIDDIVISVPVTPTITTGALNPTTLCAGTSLNVPYTITGTYTAGNIFTAQLSNSIGSFASPTNIGTLNSTSSGTVIATIPAGTTTGSGYLVRVVSSTPAITGSSSGPITINALPTAVAGSNGTICAGNSIQLTSGGGATYSWAGPNSFSSSTQNPAITSSTTAMSGVYTVTVTSSDGCSSTATTTAFVVDCSGVEDETMLNASIYPNPAADQFTIGIENFLLGKSQMQIMNLVGEVVYATMLTQENTVLHAKSLNMNPGLYLIRLSYENQNKVYRLIIK